VPSTQFYRTGLRHCPNIGGADFSGGRNAVNPNLYRRRCTAGCPPNHSVIKCRCVRQIVQKGLAFGRHWSGTVGQFRAPRAPRDPAPPAPLPRWGFGGAARRRGTERGISMSKSSKKGPRASAPAAVPTAKPSRHTARDAAPNKADASLKQSRVVAMLQSPTGATIDAMMKATGWQSHSVRGFLAGVVRKRLKLKLGSKKVDGNRVYQIVSGNSGTPSSRRPQRRPA
jgi:hypothetical protein